MSGGYLGGLSTIWVQYVPAARCMQNGHMIQDAHDTHDIISSKHIANICDVGCGVEKYYRKFQNNRQFWEILLIFPMMMVCISNSTCVFCLHKCRGFSVIYENFIRRNECSEKIIISEKNNICILTRNFQVIIQFWELRDYYIFNLFTVWVIAQNVI